MTNLNSIKLSIIEESTTRRLDEVAKLEQDKIKLTNFIKFLTYLRSFTSDKSKAFEVAVLAFNQQLPPGEIDARYLVKVS